ncbi:MAG TPA: saccharopine dehydrogenase NADP-binding domain-containing protein [Nevskiaceae bacterium]|nr:saccharopine dehydrogenase NADP-binding domain-containing protein [Nevskiaceae bacterium]
MHTVLVLGGYGFFGTRISTSLASAPGLHLLIGGRSFDRAQALARDLRLDPSAGVAIDADDQQLAHRFLALGVQTLIHTAGPFQGQDYRVARAAIEAGCHYIDLADSRAFVCGIGALDAPARERGVCVISGASSVPALSSAVVEQLRPQFSRMDSIRIGISTGARVPGLATVRAIFSYCGKPIRRLEQGRWLDTYGWLDMQRHRFPSPLGMRLLGSCDVPDLDLLPRRYPSLQTTTFHAGISGAGHFAIWLGALVVRAGLLRSLASLAPLLHRAGVWMEPAGSEHSGMYVELAGLDHAGHPLLRRWHLVAARHHGPYVPCGASVALARKLLSAESLPPGAYPCTSLLTVEEYLEPLRDLDLRVLA